MARVAATSRRGSVPVLGIRAAVWQFRGMSNITIALPDSLDATLVERMKSAGIQSKEDYLISLVESDCAAGTLEAVLAERMEGPFGPLEPDWKDRVRNAVAKRKEV